MKAAALERILTGHESGAWAPEALEELDTHGEFPAEAIAVLDDAGLAASYVLTPDCDFPAMVELIRTVARRDLTVAIAHCKTFLGSVPVWVAGTPEQAGRLTERVRAGDSVCWGLTERDHGSDLLAGELTATEEDGTWRLDGEKYLINNAARARFSPAYSPVRPGRRQPRLQPLPRRPGEPAARAPGRCFPRFVHTASGAPTSAASSCTAHRCPPTRSSASTATAIGIVLSSLQLTRIACTGLSLGAADHALRLARDFARAVNSMARRMSDLPHVRRTLGRAAAAALTAEAVSALATRSVHDLPGELCMISAIAKAYVPTPSQDLSADSGNSSASTASSPRSPGGGFAKLDRDHRICAIFDGSTVVNRTALLTQMPRLGRLLRLGIADTSGVHAAADLDTLPQSIDLDGFTLTSATGCSLVQSLPEAVERIREQGNSELTVLAATVLRQSGELATELRDFIPVSGGLPSSAFTLAERYERLYAAAACLTLWLYNPGRPANALTQDALWPRACLAHLLDLPDNPAYDDLASAVCDWTAPAFTLLDGAL